MYFRRYYTVLWHVDPLLGNDLEISSYTIAVAKLCFCKQRPLLSNGRNNRRAAGRGALSAVRAEAI
jgi:hypothetical protein